MSDFAVIEGDVVITDVNGNPVGVVIDGAIYRLQTSADIAKWMGSAAPTVGQKAMIASIPVVLPNDQTVAVSTAPEDSTPGFTRGDVTTAALTRVACRRTAYTEQTVNAAMELVSSSASDDGSPAGTGAHTVRITYLTSGGVGPSPTTVILNGTTAVPLSVTDTCLIEKMEVLAAGSTGSNVGILTLRLLGGGATVGTIAATQNTTFWSHHYVPAGKTCNITTQWCGHNGTTVGSGATLTLDAKPIAVANAIETQVSDSFRLYGQSSSVQRNYGSPIQVVGPARLVSYVTPETSTSTNYRSSFDYYEVDT